MKSCIMAFKVGEKYKVKKDYGLLRKGVILILRSRDVDILGDIDIVTLAYYNANTDIEVNIKYDIAIDILEPLESLEPVVEKEIDLINKIIYESIIHGGDYGGPYYINSEDLEKSVNNWLEFKNLTDEYEFVENTNVSDCEVPCFEPKIIKKENR